MKQLHFPLKILASFCVMLFLGSSAFAQSAERTQAADDAVSDVKVEVVGDKIYETKVVEGQSITVIKDAKPNLPYFNYKGIKDLAEAKKQWVQDNPAAYNQMLNGSTTDAPKE